METGIGEKRAQENLLGDIDEATRHTHSPPRTESNVYHCVCFGKEIKNQY